MMKEDTTILEDIDEDETLDEEEVMDIANLDKVGEKETTLIKKKKKLTII